MKVLIEKLDHLGQGICHINNKVCFVKNALPNELVDIKIVEDKKKYFKGEVLAFETKSLSRRENKCPYFKFCGGCSLGHLNYKDSLDYKKNKIKEIIKNNLDLDIEPNLVASEDIYYYRNKVTLKIVDYKWGYYNRESHNFIPIKSCLLAKGAINQIIEHQEAFKVKSGEITLRCNNQEEILISLTTNCAYKVDLEKLKALNIVGIVVNNKILFGKDYFYHKINNLTFKISYNSFFQINDNICSKIFDLLNDTEVHNILLDLYCGVGSLGISLSHKIKKLYGIEIESNAIKDAKINALLNNITNSTYLTGKVESNLDKIKNHIDTIIVDPPRKGLANTQDILKIQANTLIYISCDPVTLGRDLKKLKEYYNVETVYCLDMFPNTYHVESYVVLKRK